VSRSRDPRRVPRWAPEPPEPLPPGRILHVPGRGEFFLRDSGGADPSVLLLHGWMFSADLNWFRSYAALRTAGYRVLAVDHRGHGRGLRTYAPFRLEDCAADAAAVLETLETGPALVAGYSMGGPITQFLARDHPEAVRGMVLCATSREWADPRMKALWNGAAAIRLLLGLAPYAAWRRGLRAAGFPDSPATTWVTAELTRGSARDLAEAGRELGRFDSRPWVGSLAVPAAVVVTTKDTGVPPYKQRELAEALGAPTFDVPADHAAATANADLFNPALLAALEAVAA
jgi:pimeloyl-ACP methyl ester carboxylesterase